MLREPDQSPAHTAPTPAARSLRHMMMRRVAWRRRVMLMMMIVVFARHALIFCLRMISPGRTIAQQGP